MHTCTLPLITLDCCWHPLFVQEAAVAARDPYLLLPRITCPNLNRGSKAVGAYPKPILSKFRSSLNSFTTSSNLSGDGVDNGDDNHYGNLFNNDEDVESQLITSGDGNVDGVDVEIEKVGKNSRRIHSSVAIKAELCTIWNVLTDYERLADFIPGLSVSRLIEKSGSFARLFQIGQQNLAFGLKFNAKGIVDCYEKDLESLPYGQKRDIEFRMIEGDFKIFEGRWSIEQCNGGRYKGGDLLMGQEFHTTLSYIVDVEPKLWLPVRIIEGRLCREIKLNLSCIREEAEKATHNTLPAH
ncbi:uncharacterized protein LOC131166188 isoform X1 [Malania oleifera]|uniref:uncharacterized protein LOC131166188 isoform X1 n=1 Tax=Malania oleifera TaxID=397392 RepID=UPI0025AD9EBC|nr:uncharacterized protein LOC131166188 isoform X1 [Malania oleifera]XP_057980504.1 uncharacterized protein LOC131166188 isoform X1 [Malania oleifera]XP_057980505.1 uncharacterized protein LOC131166188 isoform X1 [Malania oleifera]